MNEYAIKTLDDRNYYVRAASMKEVYDTLYNRYGVRILDIEQVRKYKPECIEQVRKYKPEWGYGENDSYGLKMEVPKEVSPQFDELLRAETAKAQKKLLDKALEDMADTLEEPYIPNGIQVKFSDKLKASKVDYVGRPLEAVDPYEEWGYKPKHRYPDKSAQQLCRHQWRTDSFFSAMKYETCTICGAKKEEL